MMIAMADYLSLSYITPLGRQCELTSETLEHPRTQFGFVFETAAKLESEDIFGDFLKILIFTINVCC